MKLQELLDVICDEVVVYLWGDDGTMLDKYDGKDSISDEWNDEEVLLVTTNVKGIIEIVI